MRKMAFRVCKIGTFLTLLFAVPMALEIDNLLLVWLKNPPPMASELCISTLAFIVIEKLSSGHLIAVNATGRVARFQTVRGLLRTLVAPFALALIWLTNSVIIMSISLPVSALVVVLGDVSLARARTGMSIGYWVKCIAFPVLLVVVVSICVGMVPRLFWSNPWIRLLVTTASMFFILSTLAWMFFFDRSERIYVIKRLKYLIFKFEKKKVL
jgi:hypothetical protein